MKSSMRALPTQKRWCVHVYTNYGTPVCLVECNGRSSEVAIKKARGVLTKQGKACWLYRYVPVDRENQSKA